MSYDQHMPPPDWGRVQVNSDQKRMPVGDPTLWANTVRTEIDAPGAVYSPRSFYSEQIVMAHAGDRYARSWSISGSLSAPFDVWTDPNAATPPYHPFPPEGGPRLSVYLSVLQGIEKVTIEHLICLICGGDESNIGLCHNQSTVNGGPYLPTFATFYSRESEQTRPFAAIGALIGNTISARAYFVRSGTPVSPGVIPSVAVSLLLTPYAPGAGI